MIVICFVLIFLKHVYNKEHISEEFFFSDAKLKQNQVAGFLSLLRNMIQNCPSNQENLVRTKAVATLGALLQKVV